METTPEPIHEPTLETLSTNKRIRQAAWIVIIAIFAFLIGFGSGYLTWGQDETAASRQQKELTALYDQVNPKDGYTLPVSYGDLGSRLIEGGVIDYDTFAAVYKDSGSPLSAAQIEILTKGSDEPITITAQNAHFLLNYFWAVGLANKNPILTAGPMVLNSGGQVERFASTGGWTLATKPITEIYANLDLIPLTAEQQRQVEEVAAAIHRPCCNNPTLFPDCNHGMAMLGLLELMASKGASVDQMYAAAKYVNAFWFPQQTLEAAMYLKANQGLEFTEAEPRLVVSKEFSSAAGANMVHEYLQSNGLLKPAPDQGGGCSA